MSINLDKIDLLKERANVSYKEAKEALEKFDGDLVEALIYLEEEERIVKDDKDAPRPKKTAQRRRRPEDSFDRKAEAFEKKAEDFFTSLHHMRFKIYRKNETLLNIPATIAILVGFFTIPFSILVLVAAVLFGYHIAVIKPDGDSYVVDEVIKEEFKDEFQSSQKKEQDAEADDSAQETTKDHDQA